MIPESMFIDREIDSLDSRTGMISSISSIQYPTAELLL